MDKNVWVTIKDFNINIHGTDEGVVVDIYGRDKTDPIASTYAFDAETIEQGE